MSTRHSNGRFVRIAGYSLAVVGLVALYIHFDSPPTPYEELSARVADGWTSPRTPGAPSELPPGHECADADRMIGVAWNWGEPNPTMPLPWQAGLAMMVTVSLGVLGWFASRSEVRTYGRFRRRRRAITVAL